MYFLTGFRSNVETISLLSWPHFPAGDQNFSSLKRAYQGYISSIQPQLPNTSGNEIDFNNNREDLEKFAANFNEESDLRDIKSSLLLQNFEDIPEKLKTIQNAYEKMKQIYPELGLLLRLTFNTVFSLPSFEAGGGSASSAVGVLWANPRPTWSENDVIEFLIHELAHNLVFLDERRYRHYLDLNKAVDKNNWALSAILGRLRPIDKGFHSLVVATEILLFREKFTGHVGRYRVHPPSHLLREKALRSADSLLNLSNRDELYCSRLHELTLLCKKKLESISLAQPDQLISPSLI